MSASRPSTRSVSAAPRCGSGGCSAGLVKRDKGWQRVFQPLVTTPVEVVKMMHSPVLMPTADVELSPFIVDQEQRRHLESAPELGGGSLADIDEPAIPRMLLGRLTRLAAFARDAAAAAGFKATRLVPADRGPDE